MSDFFKKGEDYEIPNISNYMRFEEGDNRFRILGAFSENTAIKGIEYWKTVDGKRVPVRLHTNQPVPVEELEVNQFGDPDVPKYFWALPVWNYQDKRVQILEITQKTILNFVKKQIENPKWGDPRNYDFVVTRTNNKGKTEYTVSNDPKEKLSEDIQKAYKRMYINIHALFEGNDPFRSEGEPSESEGEFVDPDE